MPFCLLCRKWRKWPGKLPVFKSIFSALFSLLLCRVSHPRHKISKPKQSAGPDNNSRKEVRASPDTKIINPVCARSAPFLLWEMAALDKKSKVHHRSFINLCLTVQSTQHTDIVKGKYCTQAVLKDVRDNMGPPIVVTNDGVSLLYPRKQTSMQSSIKRDLASGTIIVLKQTYNSK